MKTIKVKGVRNDDDKPKPIKGSRKEKRENKRVLYRMINSTEDELLDY